MKVVVASTAMVARPVQAMNDPIIDQLEAMIVSSEASIVCLGKRFL